MPDHPAAGLTTKNDLIEILKAGDYFEHPLVPCLFQHATNGVNFTPVVDDFGIKYQSIEDLNHLIAAINKLWQGKLDISGSTYNGSNLEWNYENLTLISDMPTIIPNLLASTFLDGVLPKGRKSLYS